MTRELINLDDYRDSPTICFPTIDGNVHTLPVALVEDWISGKLKITDVDDSDILIRSILKEWLSKIERR